MESRESKEHTRNLLKLIRPKNLITIDERPHEILSMLIEPKYFRNGMREMCKCPDLFICYENTWSVIELKRSDYFKDRAFDQIKSGIEMLVNVFNVDYDNICGKLVTYYDGFRYEKYKDLFNESIN
jgi:hypothetical protein